MVLQSPPSPLAERERATAGARRSGRGDGSGARAGRVGVPEGECIFPLMSANETLTKLGRRLKTALNLAVNFVSLKVVILGTIPVIFWLLKWIPLPTWRKEPFADLSLLVASYLIVAVCIYAWKFVEAGHVLREEDRIINPRRQYFQERITTFSEAERDALAKLVITGRAPVNLSIYHNLDAAGFIDRDSIGFWRTNRVFQPELESWLKNRPTPKD
jgi:hypothetical protein